jgi:hypothetical protein
MWRLPAHDFDSTPPRGAGTVDDTRTTLKLSVGVVTPLIAGGVWIVSAAVVPRLDERSRVERTGQAPAAPAAAPLPACDRPEHRQFDFWVGEWDVRPAGQPDTAPTPLGNVVRLEDGAASSPSTGRRRG